VDAIAIRVDESVERIADRPARSDEIAALTLSARGAHCADDRLHLHGRRGAGSWLRSGSAIFADHAAEDPPPQYWCVDRHHHPRVVVGRALNEALVWTVPVEVVLVIPQDGSGVLLIVD